MIRVFLFFCLYFLTARFGLSLDAVSGFATLIWIPSGISFVVLLLWGIRFWPAVALGAFFANLLNGAPPLVALGISLGNTLEAVIPVYVLTHVTDFDIKLQRVKDVINFIIFAAVGSTMVSATIGVVSLFLGGIISPFAIFTTWLSWWIGDMISDVVLVPFLLTWITVVRISTPLQKQIETVALYFLVVLTAFVVFSRPPHLVMLPLTYITFPPLIWAAVRLGSRQTITATFLLVVIAAWQTVKGFGPFAQGGVSYSLFLLQSFMVISSATTLLLAAAIAERKQLEKRKDEFFGIASHELNTPITSIKAYGQFLQKSFQKSKDTKNVVLISKMNSQIDRLVGLITDLLDSKRIEDGKLQYNKKKFDLNALVDTLIMEFKYVYDTYTIEKDGVIEKKIFGDKDRIRQVLVNLITNAIRYSPNAKKIILHLRNDKNYALISVQDFGIGIAQSKQKRIFEQYFRINDRNTYPTGFGLGLFIASEIVKRHGGKIWVDSIKGKGTTFSFSLPLKKK